MKARFNFSRPGLWVGAALLAAAGAAQAGGVSISVGVNTPGYYGPQVGAVVSNGPVYYAPRPVYVRPPVIVQPGYYGYGAYGGVRPVIYAPPPPPPMYRAYPPEWRRWHPGRAEAFDHGYRRGYERGYDRGYRDDGRGGWGHHR